MSRHSLFTTYSVTGALGSTLLGVKPFLEAKRRKYFSEKCILREADRQAVGSRVEWPGSLRMPEWRRAEERPGVCPAPRPPSAHPQQQLSLTSAALSALRPVWVLREPGQHRASLPIWAMRHSCLSLSTTLFSTTPPRAQGFRVVPGC